MIRTLFLFSTEARALAHAESVLGVPADECKLIEMNVDDVNSLIERGIVHCWHIDFGSEDEFRPNIRPFRCPGEEVPRIRLVP